MIWALSAEVVTVGEARRRPRIAMEEDLRMPTITLDGLTKRFADVTAVHNLSFELTGASVTLVNFFWNVGQSV